MKTIIKSVSIALFVALVTLLGVVAGIRLQSQYEDEEYAAVMAQSTTIAVINQDLGVDYNDEELHFAQEVIDELGDGYALTPKAAAESGLRNGSYAALISFPSDFSKKVAQINEVKPETATFRYQLSGGLSQKDTIETLLRIMELERKINSTVSFMYTASILGELHDAQATAKQLLANDQEDIVSVQTFVTAEMVPSLHISEMELEDRDIDYPDFSSYIEKNAGLLDDFNTSYADSIDQMVDEYAAVQTEAADKIAEAGGFAETIEEIDFLGDSDGGGGGGDALSQIHEAGVEAGKQRALQTQEALERAREAIQAGMEKATQDARELLSATPTQMATPTQLMDDYRKHARDILHELLEAASPTQLENPSDTPYTNEYGYWSQGGDSVPEEHRMGGAGDYHASVAQVERSSAAREVPGDLGDGELVEQAVQELSRLAEDMLLLSTDEQLLAQIASMEARLDTVFEDFQEELIDGMDEEWSMLQEAMQAQADAEAESLGSSSESTRDFVQSQQASVIDSLTEAFTRTTETLSQASTQFSSFDMAKYLTENQSKLTDLNTQFSSDNRAWETEVADAIGDRTDLIFDIYSDYSDYVFQLREDMYLTTEEAQALLDAGLQQLLRDRLEKSKENSSLIEAFSDKLPNTHIGSQGNTDFYSFMVSPVKKLEVGDGAQNAFSPMVQKEITHSIQWISNAIYLAAAGFVLLSGGYFGFRKIRKFQRKKSAVQTEPVEKEYLDNL